MKPGYRLGIVPMRILFLALNYPPETKPSQDLIYNLATKLKVLGHQVSVVTAAPNHPGADVFEEFRSRSTCEEFNDEIKVIKTWVFPTNKNGLGWRFLSNLSFIVSSVLVGSRKVGPIDILIV